jgi:hypothetical protein
MNGSSRHREVSRLETIVASELCVLLDEAAAQSALKVEPSGGLLSSLEFYIPQLLSHHYPEWEYESLDGFYLTNARKIGSETAEFAGSCILISDQSLAPVLIRLTLSPSRDSIAAYQVFLGEGDCGRVGISGSSRNSRKGRQLLDIFSERPNEIRWNYVVSSDAE